MSTLTDTHVSRLLDALRGVLAGVSAPEAVLRHLLEQAVTTTGAQRGVFVETSPGGTFDYTVLHSYRPGLLHDPGHYSRSIFARCLATGEDVVLQDARSEMPKDQRASVALYGMGSVLCMPVRAGGRIAGLVHLEHRRSGHFGDDHRRLLRALLDVATPVLETLIAGREVLQERDRLAREAEESRQLLARDWSFGKFVGRSAPVRDLEERIRSGAGSAYPVLLTGETGTGKNVLARILHSVGPRSNAPFVTVFCPSLSEERFEDELFGHRRGAFTGADSDRDGKVQAAEGGTLFLDEIGELPLKIQPKLLWLLQEKAYVRLGDPREQQADVRVIAATNRDIAGEVGQGRFRRDLFERLNFLPVHVPPLRERREDIPAVFRHCLDCTGAGRWVPVTDEAMRWLEELEFGWPGNVRQLEQVAARATLDPPGRPLDVRDLVRHLDALGCAPAPATQAAETGGPPAAAEEGLPARMARHERELIQEAMRRHPDWSREQLAAHLEIAKSTLFKKLREHGLG